MSSPAIHVPTGHRSPCKSCGKVANLENAIARLEIQRCELKRNINRSHSLFIRMLPPEIVAKISGFANIDFTIIGSLPAPILLSSVCSDWRRTVVGTPHLWSSIKIDLPSISRIPDTAASMLLRLATFIDEWLSRSGQLPLDISLCCDKISWHNVAPKKYRPVIKILDKYSSRWQNLSISIPPILLSYFRPDRLPLLEQLNITNKGLLLHITNEGLPSYAITFPPAPCLHTVKIQSSVGLDHSYLNSLDIGIQWNTVTHVSVRAITSHICFALLRLKKLVHCKIHNVVNVTEDHLDTPILSPLTYLSLHHESDPSRILDSIKLPCLETLVLLNVTIDPVIALLKRSACSLHTLSLQNWLIRKTDKLIPLLQFLSPSLTALAISRNPSSIHGTKNYLSLLARIYTSQSEVVGNDFLPRLEIFEYTELQEPLPTSESSMLSNLLPSRDYQKPATSISLRSAYINIASVINMDIPYNISPILQRLEEDGILTYI